MGVRWYRFPVQQREIDLCVALSRAIRGGPFQPWQAIMEEELGGDGRAGSIVGDRIGDMNARHSGGILPKRGDGSDCTLRQAYSFLSGLADGDGLSGSRSEEHTS